MHRRRPPSRTLLRGAIVAWALALGALVAQSQSDTGPVKQERKDPDAPARAQTPARPEPKTPAKDAKDAPKTAAEDELKSAFILQFARYVAWTDAAAPRAKNAHKKDALTIAVVGDEDLGATMAAVLRDKRIDERPVLVTNLGPLVKLTDRAVLKECQVLVFGGDAPADWLAIREELGKSSVLTVSTMPGFARRGGMIELYPDGKTLRFEVAQRPLTDVGLSASSKLLRLSQPRPDPGADGEKKK